MLLFFFLRSKINFQKIYYLFDNIYFHQIDMQGFFLSNEANKFVITFVFVFEQDFVYLDNVKYFFCSSACWAMGQHQSQFLRTKRMRSLTFLRLTSEERTFSTWFRRWNSIETNFHFHWSFVRNWTTCFAAFSFLDVKEKKKNRALLKLCANVVHRLNLNFPRFITFISELSWNMKQGWFLLMNIKFIVSTSSSICRQRRLHHHWLSPFCWFFSLADTSDSFRKFSFSLCRFMKDASDLNLF